MLSEILKPLVVKIALEIDPDANLETWPEALAFQMDMAQAIITEARKQDTALIRQLVEALELPCDRWNKTQSEIVRASIIAGRARLNTQEGK